MKSWTLAALTLALIAGCAVTEVKLTPAGESVRLGQNRIDAQGCDEVGKVVGYSTNLKQDIDLQRSTNARNRAAAMGANLIVPGEATLVTVGGREFIAYRCPS